MTITLTGAGGLFTILSKAITAAKECNTHHGTTTPANVDLVIGEMADADTIDAAEIIAPLASATRSYRSISTIPQAVKTFVGSLVMDRVLADKPATQATLDACLDELLVQFRAANATVEKNVVSATVTHPHADAPRLAVSVINPDGTTAEAVIDESIVGTAINTTQLSIASGAAQANTMAPDWPLGSQLRTSLSLQQTGVLLNQSFDNETVVANSPDDWIVETGVVGTTVAITNSEVQTITVGGTPTSGTWTISHTSAAGVKQTTYPLPYNASASDVQAALAEFVGWSSVTVTYATAVYTVNFNAVAPPSDQPALTTTNTFNTGTLTVAQSTAGQDAMEYKALAILGTSGTEATTLRQRAHSLNLSPKTSYAVGILAKKIASTTGTMYLELVDGTGTVIHNDAGADNQISVDIDTGMISTGFKSHYGFFQTPSILPDVYYFQIRFTDLADTKGVYLDDCVLAPAQRLYQDGPYACLLPGLRLLTKGEQYTVAVANDWAGLIQTWFYRWFGRLLPSATSGAETIDDPS